MCPQFALKVHQQCMSEYRHVPTVGAKVYQQCNLSFNTTWHAACAGGSRMFIHFPPKYTSSAMAFGFMGLTFRDWSRQADSSQLLLAFQVVVMTVLRWPCRVAMLRPALASHTCDAALSLTKGVVCPNDAATCPHLLSVYEGCTAGGGVSAEQLSSWGLGLD